MLIREIEYKIVKALRTGARDPKELATLSNLEVASLQAQLRRMAIHQILEKKATGTYELLDHDLVVATDREVNAQRKNKALRPGMKNPFPHICGEELEDLKEYLRIQSEEGVARNLIIKRLKKYGYSMTRLQLLQFMECHSLSAGSKRKIPEEVA